MELNLITESNMAGLNGRPPRAITVAILAMGGEGGGVLADWIVDLAERSGYLAQTTSVPGVAQRTGSTIYYIELFPESSARSFGKSAVLALMPVPGEVDVVIASELMEAGRAVQRGLVTPDRTTLIASTNRVFSMTEKTAVADGQVDAGQIVAACAAAAKVFVRNDFARLAVENRSAISAVLLGAVAGASALPFERAEFEEAIRRSGVGVEASLAAFGAGFRSATQVNAEPPIQVSAKHKVGARLQPLASRIENNYPPESYEILLVAVERLADYQDEAYASEYLDRLEAIREIDARNVAGHSALLRETGRNLALWMSYEDAARVADLKTRRARFERVQRESRAGKKQLVQINEYLYPRIEEFADMMPAGFGRWLLNTNGPRRLFERLTQHGMVVTTTSLRGFLQLYCIAGLRRWRRSSLRFQEEHKRILDWIAKVAEIAPKNYVAAVEIAEFPRVVKGYGDTHIHGRRKFDMMMKAVATSGDRPDAASYLRSLREAALADENGEKLSQMLIETGKSHEKLSAEGASR